MYRIIALDLDGTLTNAQKEITPQTREALMKAQEMGVRIILATGRPPYGVVPLAEELELARYGGFILCYNGGLIQNYATKECIFEQKLSLEELPYLCKRSSEAGFTIMTYKETEIYTENPADEYVHKASFINKMPIHQVAHFQTDVPAPIYKCLIVGEPEGLHELEEQLKEEVSDRLDLFRSMPYFIEVVPKGINKAHSLDVLMKSLGLTRENLIAVGDGWNDASMIQYAGMGVAMANAQPEVKAVADYITLRTNEEDGVAEVVEKFLL